MWVFTKHGFYSVVQHIDDPDKVLVRSRQWDHLAWLRCMSKEILGKRATFAIQHTPYADYPYRCVMTRHRWTKLVKRLANDIDYTNFKDAAVAYTGDQLFAVWREMRR